MHHHFRVATTTQHHKLKPLHQKFQSVFRSVLNPVPLNLEPLRLSLDADNESLHHAPRDALTMRATKAQLSFQWETHDLKSQYMIRSQAPSSNLESSWHPTAAPKVQAILLGHNAE